MTIGHHPVQPHPEHRDSFIAHLEGLIPELRGFGYQALEAEALMAIHRLGGADESRNVELIELGLGLTGSAARLWRQVANARRILNDVEGAACAYEKVTEVLSPHAQLATWKQEVLDKSYGQAGLAWHELAQAASQTGDKSKAAACMLKAAMSFSASPLPLKDWQAELVEKYPARAGLAFHELSKEAEAAGDKARWAELLLQCAQAYAASPAPLKDWAITLRDRNPARAGGLYMELAKEAETQGQLALAAQWRLRMADAFRAATVPLAAWQQEPADLGPARAGYLHHQLAEDAKLKDDKLAQAEHLAASADAFARSTVSLKPWQIEARDGNHLKAGKLVGAVAEECQAAVRGEKLADLYFKAASYYKAAPIQGSASQVNTMGDMCLKAADLYRQANRYKVDFLFAKEISCFAA
jgi:hypothetical protein